MSVIDEPFTYYGDPTKSRALFNGSLYFGLPDTDPTIASNQKLVRAIQEDGTEVSLSQPVSTNSGGYPTYNGSPVRLSVTGDYSFVALNSKGTEVYAADSVSNPEPGSDEFSGVVVKEAQTLASGQTTVVFATVGANESVFYLQSTVDDQGFLEKDVDYTVTNSTTIELTRSYSAGSRVVGRMNDPTGQLVEVRPGRISPLVYNNFSEAQTEYLAGNIDVGDYIMLRGRNATVDGRGGDLYLVQAISDPDDGVNYLDLDGTNQLLLLSGYYRFKYYSERFWPSVQFAAGAISVDVEDGPIQELDLNASATSISFSNANPDTGYASSVTLRVTQNGGGNTINWGSILWNGGVAPTMTATNGAIDIYGFTTFDAGVTWYGFVVGQAFA